MQLARVPIAADPRAFGRAGVPVLPAPAPPSRLAGDIKLFATTFLAGFVFVSVLLA
jgi:hypothetical protein